VCEIKGLHVALMRENRNAYRGNLKETDHMEALGIDGRIILK
jgi:hypothetical protein